jgi:putative nucleotidyltransferase with HDIG domain
MYKKSILEKLDNINEIPPSLVIATEINKLLSDPKSSVEQIGNVLRNDPALTAKVLRLANSAIFAQSKRIVSINQAISTLGLAEFSKLTSTITFLNAFRLKYINYNKYWLHSLATAFIAVKINEQCKASINPERLFTGGILHDIGVLILDIHYTDIYKKVFEIALNKKIELSVVEESVLGITHAEVGAIMLKKWGLPDQITDIILCHHKPQYSDIVRTDTQIVYLANFIANNRGFDNGAEPFIEGFYEDVWEELNLTVDDIPVILNCITTEIEKAKKLLQLGGS